ncbi:MAG: hypothetical protein E7415_04175 [Ruminococcaceae bacterium]|nr:hypothetical protein [Oscillospiraceae bacterium]
MIRYYNQPSGYQEKEKHSAPPPKRPYPPPTGEEKREKGFLSRLPKEIYNCETHKFFGFLTGEDILIIGLILMVLDRGCDEDLFLILALLYILVSDWIDFGNILA